MHLFLSLFISENKPEDKILKPNVLNLIQCTESFKLFAIGHKNTISERFPSEQNEIQQYLFKFCKMKKHSCRKMTSVRLICSTLRETQSKTDSTKTPNI